MNKGQMEIFGLVMIVILLAVGLLFAVIILTKEPSGEVARVKASIQAANFLNTLMSTTSVGCGHRDVRKLLQNCALARYDDGGWTNAAMCGETGKNTCEMAAEMIPEILDKTMKKWGRQYHFFIEGSDAVIPLDFGEVCTGEREGASRPEKARGLDLKVTLHLC